MPLLELIDEVCAAEENYDNVCSDEPRDELGDRRRERAFREMWRARRALRLYRQVQLIRRICLQNKLPCEIAGSMSSFL